MKTNNRICIITNIAPHYRQPIFQLIDKTFDCSFYSGDKMETAIKTFDYNCLKGYKRTLSNIFFGHLYWQRGAVRLVFAPYQYYILDGEPFCLSSWFILILTRLIGKTTIAWSHGWYGKEHGVKKIVKKAYYSLFSKLMLYSEYSIHLMEKEGFDSKKLFCIANSLDSDHEQEIRKILKPTNIYTEHFHNSYPTIIYCGRIQKRKKLHLLLDAIRILKEQGNMTNLIIVGTDSEGVNLMDYAKLQELESHIWMYGACYDDTKLSELFYNASVCVSPGNIGLTAIHALSFGCPVITHDDFPYQMPEFEAIIPGKTGDFFAKDNANSLAKTIQKWIGLSAEERARTSKAAFTEIDRKWNIHHQIQVLKKVLNDK